MSIRTRASRLPFLAAFLLLVPLPRSVGAAAPAPLQAAGEASVERVVAGSPGDFMQVRHVRLEGSSRAIGRELARIAAERHGFRPQRSPDEQRTRAQRHYFEHNYPAQVERMKGVADRFDLPFPADRYELAGLPYGFGAPGCTVVYYPPGTTEAPGGVVSRNFDFTTGNFEGKVPAEGEEAVCGAPYLLELHPDDGYASLSLCCYDLLGGVVDGINSEGLTVALLADDELVQRGLSHPVPGPQAGFGVVQITRFLLDTCADVEEAEAALLEAKLYYGSIPCHYLVADRHGRSFVWENTPSMATGRIFEGDAGEPLVTTNFLRVLHDDLFELPAESHPLGSFNRYRTILDRFADEGAPVSLEFVKATNACVAARGLSAPAPYAPARTLWHALYYPEDRRLEVDFYLGEEAGTERRSGYLEFALADENAEAAGAARVGARGH